MRTRVILGLSALTFVSSTLMAAEAQTAPGATPSPVKFVMHRLDTHRTEACGVGDFNNDGKNDIIAGQFLYLAPDFKPLKIRTIQSDINDQGKGYAWDFMNAPLDVDGDGLLDCVSCSWFGKLIDWYRNTGSGGGEWPQTVADVSVNYECGDLVDIDGDGKELEVLPSIQPTVWFEVGVGADGKRTLVKHVVDEARHPFGAGVGDVNGDGRPDVLRTGAWFEAPADPRAGQWKQHPLAVGGQKEGEADHTPQILVYDINADGLADILTSSAHKYGIFWYEQVKQGQELSWKRHTIDDTWTQAHSLTLADFDGDGDLDLATGKRFMAHNGKDPGEFEPLGVYWYELVRGPEPAWKKHVVSYGEAIGSGLNIPVVDLDGDGDLDIVVTGKWGGPVWFENKKK